MVVGTGTVAAQRNARQLKVSSWVVETFGETAMKPRERARRLLEEAIELAQAEGVTREEVTTFADYIYAKEPGDPEQELGGVSFTLLAYAQSRHMSADYVEVRAIQDAFDKSAEHWHGRQQTKIDAGMSEK